ncbi:hypothetical protein KBY91_19130 [Streptomyces sp. RK23]|uniref:hypothetical protein n=1 Tax=unclassified Streptomyces TaxID=2593676 RepID=UPI001B361720|nr:MULTISPECIES: hypothetical protein [unclassified Streptomyces]MBQ0963464.1 hypothetical protein [Streptomyces sp. RK74B]MBQ1005520.1 hypothetical protein [Streptomyces sp. RK23]
MPSSHAACDHPKTSNERAKCRKAQERTPTPRQPRVTHDGCVHPDTSYERRKCRDGHYIPGTMERAPSIAQMLKSVQPKPAPKLKREPRPPKPRLTPEEIKAKRDQWGGKGRLTVPVLSGWIYRRMRENRGRQYMFTREWLYRQYPGVSREKVDAALQYLVDKGRINALPK